ncbi:MAG: NUDIX domain-containing protein [Pyrinomonadaceae bacterium]
MLVELPTPSGAKKVLIQKRRKPGTDYDGLWEIPQGRIKRGESFLDAAQRELKEETSMRLASLDPAHGHVADNILGFAVESFSPFMCVTDPGHDYVGIAVLVSAAGEPAASEESGGHRWVDREEVVKLISSGLVFPLNVPLLKAYFRL